MNSHQYKKQGRHRQQQAISQQHNMNEMTELAQELQDTKHKLRLSQEVAEHWKNTYHLQNSAHAKAVEELHNLWRRRQISLLLIVFLIGLGSGILIEGVLWILK